MHSICRSAYHSSEPGRLLRSQDALEGQAIVPVFSMAVAELFEEWDFVECVEAVVSSL